LAFANIAMESNLGCKRLRTIIIPTSLAPVHAGALSAQNPNQAGNA